MGFRAWDAYEEDADAAHRALLATFPWYVRLYIRVRGLLIAGAVFGFLALIILRIPLTAWLK